MDKLTLMLMLGMATLVPLYAVVLTSNTAALAVILTLALTPGLIEQLLGVPSVFPRAVMELAIIMIFTKALYLQVMKRGQRFKCVGLGPMMALLGVSIISVILNEQSYDSFLNFLRSAFLFYLFFLALLNLNLSEKTVRAVNGYLMLVFAFQIVTALIKFSQVGLQEGGGIGTVSVHAGEFSTTLPLFAIAFLLAFYCLWRDRKYLLWIPVFITFGILGAKRALVFYVPIVLMFVYLIVPYGRQERGFSSPVRAGLRARKGLMALILISAVTLYTGFRLMEALNPDQTMWGSFDVGFALMTVYETETNVMEEGGYFEKEQPAPHSGAPLATGRISSTLFSFRRLANEGILALLLGSGPGFLTGSIFADVNVFETLRSVGIRYGLTGLVWFLNQVGILGALLFLLFYFQMFRKGLRVYRTIPSRYWKGVALGFLGASFVFVLDFVTYSVSTLTMGSLTAVYYYVAAACFSRLYRRETVSISSGTPSFG